MWQDGKPERRVVPVPSLALYELFLWKLGAHSNWGLTVIPSEDSVSAPLPRCKTQPPITAPKLVTAILKCPLAAVEDCFMYRHCTVA